MNLTCAVLYLVLAIICHNYKVKWPTLDLHNNVFFFPSAVKDDHLSKVRSLLQKHQTAKSEGSLLAIDFTTLSEYLYLLRASTQALSKCDSQAMLYLAAAVSDFYIPFKDMVTSLMFVMYYRTLTFTNLEKSVLAKVIQMFVYMFWKKFINNV